MPLVIVCGYPCCGKTRFSTELAAYITSKSTVPVILINEESESISKKRGYIDSAAEKSTRGAIKSVVNNKLSHNTIVIVDTLNYIKGYRYEFYCIARSMRTNSCVCWIQSDERQASQWNVSRLETDESSGYTPNLYI